MSPTVSADSIIFGPKFCDLNAAPKPNRLREVLQQESRLCAVDI